MGLLKTAAKVAVASSVHGRVQRRQQTRWAAQDAAAAGVPATPAAPVPPAVPAPAPGGGPHDLMVALTSLRSAGVLTDSEFAEISARIFS
ncbi:hypothetical protein [Gordonia sp. (in: high G+C Gram-positive bacteria)]|uniref:hypothetical protein n=1 Tax=Gordonia sp. (in: high G+C Gram-positive bacteria) TaxID=84139 RepID=UPI00260911EC|nr:hypothetical protein [Gordonia sp. (in: high G+C Gram-positive bacteria)]